MQSEESNNRFLSQHELEEFANFLNVLCFERIVSKLTSFDLYFDTHDVAEGVVGLYHYYHRNDNTSGFTLDNFASHADIVRSLAVDRRLGNVHILPPHQHELSDLIKRNFNIPKDHAPRVVGDRFVKEILDKYPDIKSAGLHSSGENYFSNFALMPVAYHAAICLEKDWRSRLKDWLSTDGGLVLDNQDSPSLRRKIIAHLETSKYRELLDNMIRQRGLDRSENCRRDTLAIAYLHVKASEVKEWIRTRSSLSESPPHLPVFFDSFGTFQRYVDEAHLTDELTIECDGEKSSVFRSARYLVLQHTLLPGVEEPLDKLQEIRSQIVFAQKSQNSRDVYGILSRSGSSVTASEKLAGIYKLGEIAGFAESVWLPYCDKLQSLGADNIEAAFGRLVALLPSPEEANILQQSVHELRGRVLNDLSTLGDIFAYSDKLIGDAKSFFHRHKAISFQNGILDFGLSQFCIPASLHGFILEILSHLWHGAAAEENGSGEGGDAPSARVHYLEARVTLAELYLELKQSPVTPEDASRTITLCSTLWALKKFDWLNEIRLIHADKLVDSPARVILADAAMSKYPASPTGDARPARAVIKRLEQSLSKEKNPLEQVILATNLGFLHFKLWEYQDFSAVWDGTYTLSHPTFSRSSKLQIDIDKAIAYTEEAIQKYPTKTENNRVIVVPVSPLPDILWLYNAALYMLVEGAELEIVKMDSAAQRMLSLSSEANWSYLYDDTLARYYHRSSKLAKKQSEWLRRIEAALSHVEVALSKVEREDVRRHWRLISMDLAQGFKANQ